VAVSTGNAGTASSFLRLTPELQPSVGNNLFGFALPESRTVRGRVPGVSSRPSASHPPSGVCSSRSTTRPATLWPRLVRGASIRGIHVDEKFSPEGIKVVATDVR
jgi:hypothetical protein